MYRLNASSLFSLANARIRMDNDLLQMDRTSILGDTIDYMKELLERINKLQDEEEMEVGTSSPLKLMGISKDLKPNEVLVRNSPKVYLNMPHLFLSLFRFSRLLWAMDLSNELKFSFFFWLICSAV